MATLLHAPMDPSSLAPPPQAGLPRAVGMALLAHVLLIAALTWGVNWKSQDSPTVEAEIWSSVRQQAAPRAVEPPAPQPVPEPPKPQPKVEPPPAPPKPAPAPPPPDTSVRDAQIALEREKKKREEAKELAEQREEQQRKAADKKRLEQQAQAKRDAQEKADKAEKAEKAAKVEKADRDKAEKTEKAEKAEKAAADAKRQQAVKAQQERESNARRDEQLRRMQGLAGASGGATATGGAMQSSGPSASYGGKVAARVRPNIVFPDSVPGNPSAEVEVRAAPDGTITGKRLVKSSGNKAWDDAVLRAIDKTETLPRDTDGRVPPLLVISFRPKE